MISVASCRGEGPPVQQPNTVDDVELSDLLANPDRYHRARIRVKGIARIEFEGNSLYSDRSAFESRAWKKAVWLGVGWPVKDDVLALNGKNVVIEGRFDTSLSGHEGAFVGSIIEVSSLAPVP